MPRGDPASLRWGIVGIGSIADRRIAPAIAADRGSELVAVVSRDARRGRSFAAAHGAQRAYTDYGDLLADPGVDAIAVTTPNGLHAQHVIAAAAAGKHVFCDKPLATTAAAAREAVDACRAARVKLGVNFEFRQAPWFQAARRAIAAGVIGDVTLVQLDSSSGLHDHAGWRNDPELAGMGVVANIGVHLGDVLRFVLDAEVEEVAAMLDVGARAGEEMETLALAVLRFEGGALAHVTASQRSPKPLNDLVIHGTRGRIDGRGLGSPGWLMRHGTASVDMRIATDAREERFDYEVDGVFERTLAAFADAVRAAAEPEPSGLDGLRSAELMEAIAESARSGRTVRPAEVSAWQ